MYHFIERCHTLYELLQDEQSKDIFRARFAIDMERSMSNVMRLISLGTCKDQGLLGYSYSQNEKLKKLSREHKKIILYGVGTKGRRVAKMLEFEHIGFYGFCGRDAEKFPDGLFGKPVLSPDELLVHKDEYYVMPVVASQKTCMEIFEFLQKHNYPESNILDWVPFAVDTEKQYFEFPELYRQNTAFIDGGCYDCGSSYKFAEWCGGAYSSIIAFESDPDNYSMCSKRVQEVPLPNFQLINACLSAQEGSIIFEAQNTEGSHIVFAESSVGFNLDNVPTIENRLPVPTVAIDDLVSDHTVGFIKMDIEGAELDALHGAKNTILRDKPLLAISAYHLRGDVFAIMDYLHQLLPEYRFLLRHYSSYLQDTVLYASVDL